MLMKRAPDVHPGFGRPHIPGGIYEVTNKRSPRRLDKPKEPHIEQPPIQNVKPEKRPKEPKGLHKPEPPGIGLETIEPPDPVKLPFLVVMEIYNVKDPCFIMPVVNPEKDYKVPPRINNEPKLAPEPPKIVINPPPEIETIEVSAAKLPKIGEENRYKLPKIKSEPPI